VRSQLAALTPPDPGQDGVAGAMRALALAGLRPASETAGGPPAPAVIDPAALGALRRLAVAIAQLTAPAAPVPASPPAPAAPAPAAFAPTSPTPPAPAAAMPTPMPADQPPAPAPSGHAPSALGHAERQLTAPESLALRQAMARTAGEGLAEQVLTPRELADYDRVLPLPLMSAGQPTPARLAVASRRTAGGQTAHFLRVDAELSGLGPISVRLSGSSGAPLAITVIASERAGPLVADGLPALGEDLRNLGIEAAIRVAIGEPTRA
jgi:hypothetical protein